MNLQAAAAQLTRFTQFLSAAKEIGEVLKVAADAEAAVEGLERTRKQLELDVGSAQIALSDLRKKIADELKAGQNRVERSVAAHQEAARLQIEKIKDSVRGVGERVARLRVEAEDAREDRDAALTYRQAEIEQSELILAELKTAAAELRERVAGLSG